MCGGFAAASGARNLWTTSNAAAIFRVRPGLARLLRGLDPWASRAGRAGASKELSRMFPISAGLGVLSCLTSLLNSATASKAMQGGNALSQLGSIFGDSDEDKKSSATLGTGGTAQPFDADTWSSLLAATSSDSTSGSSGTTTG